jgi:hypothetical protein
MYLSQDTVQILKNFSSINSNILIRKGNKLRTWTVSKTILGEATVTEDFPHEVAIYDLNQFLNCLSLVPGAELELSGDSIVISDGTNSIVYRCAVPSSISTPPDKSITLPSQDVCVVLTEDNLETVKKAASVLQIPDVSLVGDGERVYLTVRDKSNSGSNSYKIDVGEADAVFQLNLKVENLKLLPGDYDVVVSASSPEKTIGHFTNHAKAVEYYIPFENDSTYTAPNG